MTHSSPPAAPAASTEPPRTKPIVYVFAVLGGLAGLLYGYDSGAISLALPDISRQFGLNPTAEGLIVSFLLFGALPSIAVATAFEKKIERRNLLVVGAVIFGVGSLGCALAPNPETLMAFRFMLGMAAGIANMFGLIYLSEIAPAHLRGMMASLYQLSVNFGILISYGVGHYFSISDRWQWTLGLGMVPALIFGIGMALSPQSPRWLIRDGQVEKARKTLSRVRETKEEVDREVADIQKSLEQQSAGMKELFGTFRPVVILAFVLVIFQVFTGINAAVYYAPKIFEHLDMGVNAGIVANYGVGIALVISTFVSLPFIDRWGRKKLLTVSLAGQIPPLLILTFFAESNATLAIIAVFLFVFSFGFGLGPVFWTYVPEIFPLRARALGVGIITFAQYTMNALLSLIFPDLIESIGTWVFFLFAIMSGLAVWFILTQVIETKGKSLEEIEEYWQERANIPDEALATK